MSLCRLLSAVPLCLCAEPWPRDRYLGRTWHLALFPVLELPDAVQAQQIVLPHSMQYATPLGKQRGVCADGAPLRGAGDPAANSAVEGQGDWAVPVRVRAGRATAGRARALLQCRHVPRVPPKTGAQVRTNLFWGVPEGMDMWAGPSIRTMAPSLPHQLVPCELGPRWRLCAWLLHTVLPVQCTACCMHMHILTL